MEALYAKLYDKYAKLKKEKENQIDTRNREQEVKFMNFSAAADEMLQYLKSENDMLYKQVHELKCELASIRSSSNEQHMHDQKLLMEEKQKNEELSAEIARLQNLKHHESSHCTSLEETGAQVENSFGDTPVEGIPNEPPEKLVKRRKLVHTTEGTATECDNVVVYLPSANVQVDQGSDLPPSSQQPICCQMKIPDSDTSSVNCLFQYLVEYVIGMKISAVSQSNKPCVMVHHQTSGYSFSLTWINNSKGEAELLYHVLSLGAFERVAPEWMKETIMFSTSMCGVFFERVSRVVKSR